MPWSPGLGSSAQMPTEKRVTAIQIHFVLVQPEYNPTGAFKSWGGRAMSNTAAFERALSACHGNRSSVKHDAGASAVARWASEAEWPLGFAAYPMGLPLDKKLPLARRRAVAVTAPS